MKTMRGGRQSQGLYELMGYFNAIECPTHTLKMVEVGCYQGESTAIFAANFKHVYAVDCWQDGVDPFWKISESMALIENQFDIRMSVYPNVTKIKSLSVEAAKRFDTMVDFVYIDASHDYGSVVADINAWLPHIRPGGWIGGHDYGVAGCHVAKAVLNTLGNPIRLFSDSSWLHCVRGRTPNVIPMRVESIPLSAAA